MPRDIISINTTHYVGNNMYRLKLPKAVQFKKGDKLSLYSFSMYNSFYNISASQYGNSNITFTWFNGTVYNWVIPRCAVEDDGPRSQHTWHSLHWIQMVSPVDQCVVPLGK